MGTGSIVILWYGLLTVIVLLLSHERSSVTCWVSAAVAGLFLLFSFLGHRKHSLHKLFLMIALPLLFFGIGSFVLEDSGIYPAQVGAPTLNWVPAAQLELSDLQLKHRFFMDEVSGKVKNNSNTVVKEVVLRVRLNPPGKSPESYNLDMKGIAIPAGGVYDFKQTLLGIHKRSGGDPQWNLQVLSAAGD